NKIEVRKCRYASANGERLSRSINRTSLAAPLPLPLPAAVAPLLLPRPSNRRCLWLPNSGMLATAGKWRKFSMSSDQRTVSSRYSTKKARATPQAREKQNARATNRGGGGVGGFFWGKGRKKKGLFCWFPPPLLRRSLWCAATDRRAGFYWFRSPAGLCGS